MIKLSEYSGISCDSRLIKPGHIFVALPGAVDNGEAYIDKAIANGAHLIITANRNITNLPVPIIYSDNPRHEYAIISAQIYAPLPGHIVAITGTNGKSSIVHYARELWGLTGVKGASVGTLGIFGNKNVGHFQLESALTTPDAGLLCQNLHRAFAQGADHIAIEASSHGLTLNRLDGLHIMSAGMAELSSDHLDFHSNLDNYYNAKLRLFNELLNPNGFMVYLNHCPVANQLQKISKNRKIRQFVLGNNPANELYIASITPNIGGVGSIIKGAFLGQNFEFLLGLNGRFQAENFLTASVLIAGEQCPTLWQYTEHIPAVPGRLEWVAEHNGAHIFVDYAHTADALQTALLALKTHCHGKLMVVFGCGGNRDATKRPKMGEVAGKIADEIIITDDNPRFEDPASIRQAIHNAVPRAQNITPRPHAITTALNMAGRGDILLVAGKGHETGQEIQGIITQYNDKEEIIKQITKMGSN